VTKKPLCECGRRTKVAYWRPSGDERRLRGGGDKVQPIGFLCLTCKVFIWKEESVEVTA